MDINLTTGERKFRKELNNEFGDSIFLTPKQIKDSFPEMKPSVLSFYISTLTKKGWLFKIKNGLYYLPKITFSYEKLKIEMLTRHIGFKRNVKLHLDYNNEVLWLGIDKKDKKKLKKFRELYKRISEVLNDKYIEKGDFQSSLKKIKVLYKQNIVPPGAKTWTKFYDQEVEKQITTIKIAKEKNYDRRGNPIE